MIGFILKKTEMNEKTQDRITLETWIRDDYKKVQNYLRGNPGVEGFMDSLITMEDDIRAYLRETLKTKKYGEDPENTNVFEKYMKGGKDRKYLETLVLNKVIGKKTSIDDLLDNGRARVRKLFSTKEAFDTALKKGLIQNIEIKNVILPPDPKDPPEIGSGAGFEKKELEQDKFLLFMDMLRNLEIYDDDILIIHSGILKSDMMRESTYHAIYIPRVNKTVFLNVGYGEASFVCDGEVSLEVMTTYGKEKLQKELGAIKIIFSETNTKGWEEAFKKALLGEGGKVGEKVSKEKFKEIKNRINKKIKQKIIRDVYHKYEAEIKQFFSSGDKYKERRKDLEQTDRFKNLDPNDREIFGKFPHDFKTLIGLLGGDSNCCQEGKYVKALLESSSDGEAYLEKRAEEDKNKLTGVEIREVYRQHEAEIKQHFISPSVYAKRRKDLEQTDRFKNLNPNDREIFGKFPPGLVKVMSLLGGDTNYRHKSYIWALLTSKEEGEICLEQIKQKKKITGADIRAMYTKHEEIQQYFASDRTYRKRRKDLEQTDRFKNLDQNDKEIFKWRPTKFRELVFLLGGDTKCRKGEYIRALLTSKEDGEMCLKQIEQKKELTGDEIRNIYKDHKDEILPYLSRPAKYRERIKQKLKGDNKDNAFTGFPPTFYTLIGLLGGNPECQKGGYVKALLEGGVEAGKKYLKDLEQKPFNS